MTNGYWPKIYAGVQTSFCLEQVIGVDQEKWAGIKKLVGSGKPANGNYVWSKEAQPTTIT